MRIVGVIASVLVASIFLTGCYGGLKYPVGRIMGSYVSQPVEGQEGFHRRDFQCNWQECFDHVGDIIEDDLGATVFLADKKRYLISAMHFDRVYHSCIDTTEVYICTRPAASNVTNVEVSCGNYGLSKFAAENIYEKLKDRLNKK